jgi:hypothetical protein
MSLVEIKVDSSISWSTSELRAKEGGGGEDMKAHQFYATSDTIDKLDASVQDMLSKHPAAAAMKKRDDLTIEFLNLKTGVRLYALTMNI